MRILVYGTDKFSDYGTFMRGVVVAIEDNMTPQDKKIEILTAGPHKINNFTAEFINRSEGIFKQNGIKTKFIRINKKDVSDKFNTFNLDHVVSFNAKDDDKFFDVILDKAEKNKIKSSYYKY